MWSHLPMGPSTPMPSTEVAFGFSQITSWRILLDQLDVHAHFYEGLCVYDWKRILPKFSLCLQN